MFKTFENKYVEVQFIQILRKLCVIEMKISMEWKIANISTWKVIKLSATLAMERAMLQIS